MSQGQSGRGDSLFIRGLLVTWGSRRKILVTRLPSFADSGFLSTRFHTKQTTESAKNTRIYVVRHDVLTSTGIMGRFSIDFSGADYRVFSHFFSLSPFLELTPKIDPSPSCPRTPFYRRETLIFLSC